MDTLINCENVYVTQSNVCDGLGAFARCNFIKDEVIETGVAKVLTNCDGHENPLVFTWSDEIPNTMDSSYREILYLELNPKALEIEKEGVNLQDVKLLFARLCFCKGQTGYYKITEGKLKISQVQDNTYHLYLEFNTSEVPQILHKISETFSYAPSKN